MKSFILPSTKSFPKLMISSESGNVVLFSKEKVGTVVLSREAYPIGHYSDSWHMPTFTDFNDQVTLQN